MELLSSSNSFLNLRYAASLVSHSAMRSFETEDCEHGFSLCQSECFRIILSSWLVSHPICSIMWSPKRFIIHVFCLRKTLTSAPSTLRSSGTICRELDPPPITATFLLRKSYLRACQRLSMSRHGLGDIVLVIPLRRVHFLALEIFPARNVGPFHIVKEPSSCDQDINILL